MRNLLTKQVQPIDTKRRYMSMHTTTTTGPALPCMRRHHRIHPRLHHRTGFCCRIPGTGRLLLCRHLLWLFDSRRRRHCLKDHLHRCRRGRRHHHHGHLFARVHLHHLHLPWRRLCPAFELRFVRHHRLYGIRASVCVFTCMNFRQEFILNGSQLQLCSFGYTVAVAVHNYAHRPPLNRPHSHHC